MMDSLHTILKLFFLHRRREVPSSCHPPIAHPHRDWTILLVVGGVLFVFLVTLDAWMYFAVSAIEKEAGQSVASTTVSIDLDRLEQVLDAYEERDGEHDKLLEVPLVIADPSRS